jgi:anthranilate synthase component I
MFDLRKNVKNEAKIKIRKIQADKITPISILEKMNAIVLLESAYAETGKGKYSIMILKEAFTLYKKNEKFFLKNQNGKQYSIIPKNGSFLQILKEFRERSPVTENLYEFPIPLGGLGYLGYEFFSEAEDFKFKHQNDDNGFFDSAFIFGRNFLIFDHLHDEALIVSALYKGEIEEIDLDGELDRIESELKNFSNLPGENTSAKNIPSVITGTTDGREQYMQKVDYLKKEIYKGNLIQCVLSRRVEVKSENQPIDTYRNLRMRNPSPYMFFMNFQDFIIFGSSPEVMVKVRNGNVTIRPIAGTRKRGSTQAEDIELEKELKSDIKENAEHIMLVDLARNDIGKVCVGGTVVVTEEMTVERYSNVMHLVSEVEGKLMKGKTADDVILATFPAGTVSGAPKIQAIKTIDMLEDMKRGPYAGLVGYFEQNGNFDSCITIRTAIYKDKKVWLQAGAGIVYDSVPEKEFEETENKLKALYVALGISI